MTVASSGVRLDGRFLLAHAAHFVALGFGAGLAPRAPGTFGTLVAIPIAGILWRWSNDAGYAIVLVLLFALGTWAAATTSRRLGVSDHGAIVIDEVVAFLAMLFFTGPGFARVLLAFVLFRLFDITKPPPIRNLEARWQGGIGVMADDLVAAGMALIVYALIARITGWPA